MNIDSTQKVELVISKTELLAALRLLYPDEFLLQRMAQADPKGLTTDCYGDSIRLTGVSAIQSANLDVRRRGG
jgi:hypothetical protein